MDVVGVNFGDVWVGYDDEREVTQGLDAVGEASGEYGEREVGGLEELRGCKWWPTVSAESRMSNA